MTAEAYESFPTMPSGRVRLRDGDRLTISLESPGSEVITRRAASCLLAPEPGDRVLLTLSPEPFVLAVLERDGDTPASIELEGDARIATRGGTLELSGTEGLRLKTPKLLGLAARAFKLHSDRAEIASDTLTAVARRARGSFEDSGVVARTIDAVADRITQKTARAYRIVSELDQLRARHFDHRADCSARISSENTVVTAREVVKVDGEQVHIG